jgi:hypothetical protein
MGMAVFRRVVGIGISISENVYEPNEKFSNNQSFKFGYEKFI